MVLAICAVPAGVAVANDNPPPVATTVDVPTTTQPESVPDAAVPTQAPAANSSTPVSLPVPGAPVQGLLIKQVRAKLVLATKSANRWQKLLGHKPLRPLNIWALGSLKQASQLLARQHRLAATLHRSWIRMRINTLTQTVEHQRLVMGLGPVGRTLAVNMSVQERFVRVRALARVTRQQYDNPPHKAAFECIHHYEGSWTDSGAPYWGGLQMNYGFQATYGGWLLRTKGTADHWTSLEQIWVAEKAAKSRGFYPWPNTARYCGLI